MHENSCEQTTFGYLSTLELDGAGIFGGYLLISSLGRPVEFHCTTPVQPSPIQRILYGPTLPAYLLGEQIGGALLAKSRTKPRLVITDRNDAFCLFSQSGCPMVCLQSALNTGTAVTEILRESAVSDSHMNDADAQNLAAATYPILPAQDAADLHARSDLEFGDHRFRLSPDCELERDAVRALLQQLATHVDLAEPFGRIHEAIREAQRISEQEFDADARAA